MKTFRIQNFIALVLILVLAGCGKGDLTEGLIVEDEEPKIIATDGKSKITSTGNQDLTNLYLITWNTKKITEMPIPLPESAEIIGGVDIFPEGVIFNSIAILEVQLMEAPGNVSLSLFKLSAAGNTYEYVKPVSVRDAESNLLSVVIGETHKYAIVKGFSGGDDIK